MSLPTLSTSSRTIPSCFAQSEFVLASVCVPMRLASKYEPSAVGGSGPAESSVSATGGLSSEDKDVMGEWNRVGTEGREDGGDEVISSSGGIGADAAHSQARVTCQPLTEARDHGVPEVYEVVMEEPAVHKVLQGFGALDDAEQGRRRVWLANALRTRFAAHVELVRLADFLEAEDESGARWEERFEASHVWTATHEVPQEVLNAAGVSWDDWNKLTEGSTGEATLLVAGALRVPYDEDEEEDEYSPQLYTDAVLELRMGLGHLSFQVHVGMEAIRACFDRVEANSKWLSESGGAAVMEKMVYELNGRNVTEDKWFGVVELLLSQLYVPFEDRERRKVPENMFRADPVRLTGQRAARLLADTLRGVDSASRVPSSSTKSQARAHAKRLKALHHALRAGGDVARIERVLRNLDEDPTIDADQALEVPNVHGETPLFVAAQLGKAKVVKLLIKRGANVNAVADRGWTPLMSASAKGSLDVVHVLLESGADASLAAKSRDGSKTARDWAALLRHEDVEELLRAHEESTAAAVPSIKFDLLPLPGASPGPSTGSLSPTTPSPNPSDASGAATLSLSSSITSAISAVPYLPVNGIEELAVVGTTPRGSATDRVYIAPEQSTEWKVEQQKHSTELIGLGPDIAKWSPDEVCKRLGQKRGFNKVVAVLKDRNVDGAQLVSLTEEELCEFGLKIVDAQRVIRFVERFNNEAMVTRQIVADMFEGPPPQVHLPVVKQEQLYPRDMTCIASGPFGSVYHCVFKDEESKERDVVLKVRKMPAKCDERIVQRARASELTEIVSLAMVGRHPNVVQLVGMCEDVPGAAGPCPVIVYHSHSDLSAFLATHRDHLLEEWRASPVELLTLLQGIVAGVAHLHSVGLVHGDLALDNVVLTSTGVPRVSDLGLARSVNGKWPQGTPLRLRRMPPELLLGGEFGCVGDVYMLGLLLADVVRLGEVDPFQDNAASRNSVGSLCDHVRGLQEECPVPPVGVEEAVRAVFDEGSPTYAGLVTVIRGCLAFDRAQRYQNAEAVQGALSRILV